MLIQTVLTHKGPFTIVKSFNRKYEEEFSFKSFQCIFGKQMIQKYSLSDQTVLIEIALNGINKRHVFVYDWINRFFIYNNQSEKCLPKISKSIISASGCGNVKLDL